MIDLKEHYGFTRLPKPSRGATARVPAFLTWEAPSVDVRWRRPPLVKVVGQTYRYASVGKSSD